MKKVSVSLFTLLGIVLAVTSAFTLKPSAPSSKFAFTYQLYSIDQDEVSNANGLTLSSYSASRRNDITTAAYLNNPIADVESIADWIATNPSSPVDKSVVTYYCDQSDANQVCLAKFRKNNGTFDAVLDYVSGDVDITKF